MSNLIKSGVWQYYQNNEWRVGSNLNHERKNTEANGVDTRDLYVYNEDASLQDWKPSLEWAILRCQALKSQGFDRVRLDVLEVDFKNAIANAVPTGANTSNG